MLMKKFLMIIGLLLIAVLAFGQQVTDTIPIVHTTGESIVDFLKNNAWNLALIVFLLVSEWLGSTGKVKEGSIYAWIINMIGKIIKGKADVIKSKKVGFQVIIFAVLFSGMGITATAQGPFDGFFKPVTNVQYLKHIKAKSVAEVVPSGTWFVRPAVEAVGMKYTYNKDLKQVEVGSFLATGFGVGYQHYVESNGEPYNNYGFNLLLLFNTIPLEESTNEAGISLAGTFSALKFIDIGGGYDFAMKELFVLTGLKLNF